MKFIILLFVWMYSFACIMPVERICFSSNVYLKENVKDSKIALYEMKMFSYDVYDLALDLKKSNKIYDKTVMSNFEIYFFEKEKNRINGKKFYEKNLSNLLIKKD